MSDSEVTDESMFSISSEDEIDLIFGEPRIKNSNYLEETVQNYDDVTFFEHFRVSRGAVQDIVQKYETSQFYKTNSGQYGSVPANDQVLIALWYIGHQTANFRDVADRFDVTISSIYRILRRVVFTLSNLAPQIIKWPTENEKRISEEYFRQRGFPGIIGAIDGCHIKIDRPNYDSDSYINRKGYYSIQMQAVCDHQRKIIDIFLGYPGSVHDSRVFRNSSLYQSIEEKCGEFFLLADSGYPLKKNVLTPFKDRGQLTARQINYNNRLSRNRYVIEHCFGVLKQKFRQLYHIKLRDNVFISHLIRAACVLHNIALNDGIDLEEVVLEEVNVIQANGNEDEEEDGIDRNAQNIRNRVTETLPM